MQFRSACIANGSWPTRVPLPTPIVIERWEWSGSEDELAELCERNEQLRAIKDAQQEHQARLKSEKEADNGPKC
jgi:hypothetical protein